MEEAFIEAVITLSAFMLSTFIIYIAFDFIYFFRKIDIEKQKGAARFVFRLSKYAGLISLVATICTITSWIIPVAVLAITTNGPVPQMVVDVFFRETFILNITSFAVPLGLIRLLLVNRIEKSKETDEDIDIKLLLLEYCAFTWFGWTAFMVTVWTFLYLVF